MNWDEEAYAALADEFNDFADGDSDRPTLADFDPEYVEAGGRYARRNGLAWPPRIGDYDRFWERQQA